MFLFCFFTGCADNCNGCVKNGAAKCDPEKCYRRYVYYNTTQTCQRMLLTLKISKYSKKSINIITNIIVYQKSHKDLTTFVLLTIDRKQFNINKCFINRYIYIYMYRVKYCILGVMRICDRKVSKHCTADK